MTGAKTTADFRTQRKNISKAFPDGEWQSCAGLFKAGGFTLVEMLVASAIFLTLVLVLGNVVGSLTTLSSQATSRLDAVRLTREILDLFGRDISQIVTTRSSLGTNVPFQFLVNPPDSQVGSEFKNPTAVFWQSSIASDQSSGNIAIVGYFVQKTAPNRSQLRRVFVEPTDPLYPTYFNPNDWLTSDLIAPFVAPTGASSTVNLDQGWVADGVLGFWIRCFDANGEVITKDGSGATTQYAYDSHRGFTSGEFVYSSVNIAPSSIEVGLVCIAPRDVEKVDIIPQITSASPLDFDAEIASFIEDFNTGNPRVKTATLVTRRFRVAREN